MAVRDYLKEADNAEKKKNTSRKLGEALGTAAMMTPAASALVAAGGGSLLPLALMGTAGFWAGRRGVKEYGRASIATRNKVGEWGEKRNAKILKRVERKYGVPAGGKPTPAQKVRIDKDMRVFENRRNFEKNSAAIIAGTLNMATLGAVPLEAKLIRETWRKTSFAVPQNKADPRYSTAKFILGNAAAALTFPVALPAAHIIGGIDFLGKGMNWLIGEDSAIGKLADKWRQYDTSESLKGTSIEKVGNTVESVTKRLDDLSRKFSGAAEPKKA